MGDDFWKKFYDLSETLYTSIFEVAQYEFVIKISKFKMTDQKWPSFQKKFFDSSETFYTSVFEVAENEFKKKIPRTKWRTQNGWLLKKILWFKRNFVHFGFWGRWIWIWNWKSKIQNGGPKMADFWRKTLIQAKLCTLWFLRSLNTNLKLKVQNSKWRTKNGRLLEKNSDSSETLYTLVFEVAE